MRRWQVLLIAGLIGVASLLLVPFEALISKPISPFALRALATVQPAILTAIAVMLGEITARRVGLQTPLINAWLDAGKPLAVFRRQAPPALLVGAGVAAILVVYGMTIGKDLAAGTGSQARLASFDLPLVTKLLYGGITEELLTRWALVSIFTWLGWRLVGCPDRLPLSVSTMAVVIAALLFGAGHLPLLSLITPHPSTRLVVAVLAGNAFPGMLFGALYVRRGLEAAMFAHMTSHLLATLALVAL